MKCNKTLGFIATALMALVGAVPASTQAGDIWSIEQFSDAETVSRTFPNADQPLIAGEKVKFKIRLVNRDQQAPATYYANPWTLQHVGPNEPVVDTNKMPRVGLWISGQCKFADVEKWYIADKYFTDVICSYTVKAGDLAMPLRLVNPSGTGPAMEGLSDRIVTEPYYIENITNPQLWNFFPQSDNGQKLDANKVDFTFMPISTVQSEGWTWLMAYAASRNYDLAADKAIYIQAVDFDDQYVDDEKTVWRNIGAGTTSAAPALPYISIPGGCAESQDLYVWTQDPTVAEMANGTETEYTFRDKTTRKVSRVSIKAGDTTVSFKIKGLLKGKSTEVYMAATPTNIYNAAGTLVTNFTQRTIAVIEPPPPSLSVVITPNDVTTSSDYRTPAATVMVELSQAWDQDLSVDVKMSTKDGTSAWKYIGLSDKGEGDTEYGNQIVTLTVPKGYLSSASGTMLYLYANRADDNTLKGIKFEIDETSLSPEAKAYFTGNPVSATVLLRSCTPQISAPAENYEYYNISGNVMTDFTITVADAKGELDDGTYTVYWDNAGTGASYDKITGLKANAKGELVVSRKYTTAKTYNSRFYVVNEGGAKSEVRTVKVQVNAPKMVTVTPENYPNDAKEGDTLKLKVNFSENFAGGDASGIGYVWLIPADATTSNLVESTAINGAASKIYPDQTAAADMEIKLKDGYTGCKLTFTTEVHTEDNLKPETLDSAWLGKQFTIAVTNVAPQVSQLIMNDTPMSTDGGTFAANVPVGVVKTFRVNAKEPGEIDATNKNFVTEFKFWENGMVADTVTYTGAPTDAYATHQFGSAGLNKVTVRMRDKDMTDQEWADAKEFTVNVNTVDAPAISVSAYNGSPIFNESDTGPTKGRIDINLTVPPTGLGNSSNITVMVEITRNAADNGNYPMPSVSTNAVKFKNNQSTGYFYFNGLDGTPVTEEKGFHIRAYVLETTGCPADPTKTWRQYYQESNDFDFFVVNEEPIIGPGVGTTNESPAAINVPFKITWNVKDITQDQTGMTVTWSYNGGSTTESMNVSGQTFSKEITFTSSGSKTVTLLVQDKDGGSDTRVYYYKVEASMMLELYPRGPNRGALAQFSQNYTGASGLGEGRVWASGADYPSSISTFVHEWSYQPANDLSPHVYAVGYKYDHAGTEGTGDVDDGSLGTKYGGKDFAVDSNGTWFKDTSKYGSHYTYSEGGHRDSFFYCWLYKDPEEGTSTHLNGTVQPEVRTTDYGENTVTMPEYDEEATSFPRTFLEAIFALEYYREDNVGDLNQDGIPDVYAAYTGWEGGHLYEANGGSLEEASDVTMRLHNFNGDGDYLPGTTARGGVLVTTVQNWDKLGGEFKALQEVRGFHQGLNYRLSNDGVNRNVTGTWVSDPSFSDAEWCAVARMNPDAGVKEEEVLPGAEGRDEKIKTLTTYLRKTDTSKIPENRMDPTVADTDADGFEDGYEYWFWYSATVGELVNGRINRMTGSRFDLNNIAVGTVITSDEIAAAFDPTSTSDADYTERDTDNDGLLDAEEYALGTNPVNWDTDGDGLSDYWEVLRGMNPVKPVREDGVADVEMNDDNDFMARYDTPAEWAIVNIPDLGEFALDSNWNRYVAQNEETGEWMFTERAKTNFVAVEVFRYGNETSVCVPKNRGRKVTNHPTEPGAEIFALPLDGLIVDISKHVDDPITVTVDQSITIIHDQVYTQFGFDPRTAWNLTDNGYVSDRWDPSRNTTAAAQVIGQAGVAVNTVPFTALDEYLVLKYRYSTTPAMPKKNPQHGDETYSPAVDRVWWNAPYREFAQVLGVGTTNPSLAFDDPDWVAEAMGTTTFASTNHGADTDTDGVPDGWELYVGENPNTTVFKTYANFTDDNDGLAIVSEYAGTDSCNAYADVESIYGNHPGTVSGWYNKFFPTDPWDDDTDGDGITDGLEGSGWYDDWNYGNSFQLLNHEFTFIYGNAGDSGTTFCVRGGGLNPCSVDTDLDLLPDPWEVQFAGILFKGGAPSGYTLDQSAITLINRGDRVTAGDDGEDDAEDEENAGAGQYITAGMDGTDPNDAYTDMTTGDTVTGTIRDYDFDHDGLQNFQEYLVQSVRHFRYDDLYTPLMGSWMPDGTVESLKFVQFLPMNIMDGETYYRACREAGFTATGAWDFETLGYFIKPPHDWDRVALNTSTAGHLNYDEQGFRLMLPPVMVVEDQRFPATGYLSTDPRLWDTDQDGMDDYYEMFHGLNPLLGSVEGGEITYDIIAQRYMGVVTFFYNAWTGWPQEMAEDATFDPIGCPWMMGAPEADADGDGLRNDVEALVVNMTSPQPTHTDPTPLWYTDSSSLNNASYVNQYYQMDPSVASPDFTVYPWSWAVGSGKAVEGAKTNPYMFSFEENEGYDTDGDRIADADERTTTATPISDAQKFTDPDHRQALYLPGAESAAVSYSGSFHRPKGDQYDMLRQFSVECWIQPEDVTREQVVLERVVRYTSSTLSNKTNVVRANFRIGIKQDGRLYGMFDTSDAVKTGTGTSSSFAVGTVPETNVWTHVALTYDGKELKLHQDGRVTGTAQTSLIPANGIKMIVQDAVPGMTNFPVLDAGYETLPTAFLVGATALNSYAIGLTTNTTWNCYTNYYKGYVDEVRVWDGVRTLSQIKEAYKTRLSWNDVSDLRREIYVEWINGSTRNDNDGKSMLPAELLQHYNFQTLPGATESADVLWEPSGFTEKVFDNVRDADGRLPAGSFECGWWSSLPVHSTVYANYAWVPWIQNTCAHLPFMDGSCADSQYWSEFFGGVCFAKEVYNSINDTRSMADVLATDTTKKIIFPNTAHPYSAYNYGGERAYHEFRLGYLAEQDRSAQTNVTLYAFELRTGFVGTSDLIPLGSAFAKRIPELWDGQGSSDAWELTSWGDPLFADVDPVDGIPDWWADVAMEKYGASYGFNWDSLVKWPDADGISITAREAYLRDLARGMLPGGTIDALFASRRDDDRDGLPDWWENLYGIADEGPYDDHDNDKLSNYSEFLIAEYFSTYGFPRVSPILPSTFGQAVPDYFLRVGKQPLGGMFHDHDFIDDAWEDLFTSAYTSRSVWDAKKDADDDGWSNWAEYQADTRPDQIATLGVEGATLVEFPVPIIEASIVYNGMKSFSAPIVIQAWSQENAADAKMGGLPDATWTIPSAGDAAEKSKMLGMNKGREVTVCLGPGSVVPGTVDVQFLDPFVRTMTFSEEGQPTMTVSNADADWQTKVVTDRARADEPSMGDLIAHDSMTGSEKTVGEINYTTGMMTLDLSADVLQDVMGVQVEADDAEEDTEVYNLIDLANAYVRVNCSSQKVNTGNGGTFYLADSNESSGTTGEDDDDEDATASVQTKYGHLREGKNMFVVFGDSDGNGTWTAGEPFGVVSDVDVGWSSAKFSVEMTDTNPTMARFDLVGMLGAGDFTAADALTDRGNAVNGYYTPNLPGYQVGTNLPAATAMTRVRIVRTAVNDEEYANGTKPWNEAVLDREIYLAGHTTLSEADLVADGLFDLDWGTLRAAWRKNYNSYVMTNLTNVEYRVVFGNGTIEEWDLNNTLPIRFVNVFERGTQQTRAVPVAPKGTTLEASPTFQWTHNVVDTNGYKIKDYPAFRLRIMDPRVAELDSDEDDSDYVIFDSGIQRAPARNSQGVYSWTAPVYAGMMTAQGKIFSTTNNYIWQVSMLDAKFMTPNYTNQSFRVENTGWMADGRRTGSLAINVRYFGALAEKASDLKASGAAYQGPTNLVRVQAFTSPDFAGTPVSEAYVLDPSTLLDSETTLGDVYNAVLRGLSAGTYYVSAFVDTNANGTRDSWEAWGYLCYVASSQTEVWIPKPVKVTEASVSNVYPAYETIYLEDPDTNNNGIPDCWEWNAETGLDEASAPTGNTYYTQVNTNLVSGLTAFLAKNLYNAKYDAEEYALSPLLSFLEALDAPAVSSKKQASFASLMGLPATVTEAGVKIASFSLADGLVLEATTETTDAGSGAVLQSGAPVAPVTVTWELQYAPTLADAFTAVETGKVTLGGADSQRVNVAIDTAKFGKSSGFFKVVVK